MNKFLKGGNLLYDNKFFEALLLKGELSESRC